MRFKGLILVWFIVSILLLILVLSDLFELSNLSHEFLQDV